MAQLTLEIPDEWADRLKPLQDQLPNVLIQWLVQDFALDPALTLPPSDVESSPLYNEILDFFLECPTPEAILDFKVSPPTQSRLRELLDRNREATLTAAEIVELNTYEQLEHLLILLKARAYQTLA